MSGIRWFVAGAFLLIGVGMLVTAGSADGYWQSVLIEFGSAVVLVAPLIKAEEWLEKRVEKRGQAAVAGVAAELDEVRQEVGRTTARLDELSMVTDQILTDAHEGDREMLAAFLETPSYRHLVALIDRGTDLDALADDVRVPLQDGQYSGLYLSLVVRPRAVSTWVGGHLLEVQNVDGAPLASYRWDEGSDDLERIVESLVVELQRASAFPGKDRFDLGGALERLARLIALAIERRASSAWRPQVGRIAQVIGSWAITDGFMLDHLEPPPHTVAVSQESPTGEEYRLLLEKPWVSRDDLYPALLVARARLAYEDQGRVTGMGPSSAV